MKMKTKGVSKKQLLADGLRSKYGYINYGVWNAYNMSNRQVIRLFKMKELKSGNDNS